jgi:hypothetical protein
MRFRQFKGRERLFLAIFLAFGCTVRPSGSSSRASQASPSRVEPRAAGDWEVIDHAARWATKVRAIAEPGIVTHPGYVHVTVDVGDENRVSCFVYDSPIVTGQAVLRLLRAAESGIEYTNIAMTQIIEVANHPFLTLQVGYVTTMPPHGVKGVLHLAVSPRVSQPVICSQERSRTSERFFALASEFVQNMTPAPQFSSANLQDGEVPLVDEYWVYDAGGAPSAFRIWRARRLKTGQIVAVELSSQFELQRGELRATDTRVVEYEDDRGLLAAEWLSVLNGDHTATVTLRRKDDSGSQAADARTFEYQFTSAGVDGPSQGAFSVEGALLSTYGLFGLMRAGTDAISREGFRYVPPLNLSGPTRVAWQGEGDRGMLRMGSEEFQVELADDGLPRVRIERRQNGVWRLHSRHQFER